MSSLDSKQAQTLLKAAQKAAENAYAPYSHFPVGAALLTAQGEVIVGVNVENASYGLTMCAERVAIGNAVAVGKRQFQAIAVWATQQPNGYVTPCGACRQVLAEFLGPDGCVVMSDPDGKAPRFLTMKQLLPAAFDLDFGRDESCPDTGSN